MNERWCSFVHPAPPTTIFVSACDSDAAAGSARRLASMALSRKGVSRTGIGWGCRDDGLGTENNLLSPAGPSPSIVPRCTSRSFPFLPPPLRGEGGGAKGAPELSYRSSNTISSGVIGILIRLLHEPTRPPELGPASTLTPQSGLMPNGAWTCVGSILPLLIPTSLLRLGPAPSGAVLGRFRGNDARRDDQLLRP